MVSLQGGWSSSSEDEITVTSTTFTFVLLSTTTATSHSSPDKKRATTTNLSGGATGITPSSSSSSHSLSHSDTSSTHRGLSSHASAPSLNQQHQQQHSPSYREKEPLRDLYQLLLFHRPPNPRSVSSHTAPHTASSSTSSTKTHPFGWLFRSKKPVDKNPSSSSSSSPIGSSASESTQEPSSSSTMDSVVARNTMENARSGTAILSSLRMYLADAAVEEEEEEESMIPVPIHSKTHPSTTPPSAIIPDQPSPAPSAGVLRKLDVDKIDGIRRPSPGPLLKPPAPGCVEALNFGDEDDDDVDDDDQEEDEDLGRSGVGMPAVGIAFGLNGGNGGVDVGEMVSSMAVRGSMREGSVRSGKSGLKCGSVTTTQEKEAEDGRWEILVIPYLKNIFRRGIVLSLPLTRNHQVLWSTSRRQRCGAGTYCRGGCGGCCGDHGGSVQNAFSFETSLRRKRSVPLGDDTTEEPSPTSISSTSSTSSTTAVNPSPPRIRPVLSTPSTTPRPLLPSLRRPSPRLSSRTRIMRVGGDHDFSDYLDRVEAHRERRRESLLRRKEKEEEIRKGKGFFEILSLNPAPMYAFG
ncbi:hypothetical protein BC829DRAFT_397028 [Chytridium lagenaria]|nr:hypothetical protein BC829DRAFT_397028 [Chytridium lagenaria]